MKTLNFVLSTVALLAAGSASAQSISVSPTSLSFSAQASGAAVAQTITVTASGGNVSVAPSASQPWLSISPAVATTPATFTITASPAGLIPGTYQDTNFRITNLNTSAFIVVPVTFTVSSIAVTPQTLSFSYTAGSGVMPPAQNLSLSGQAVNYSVTETTATGGNWFQPAVPSSGALPGNNQVEILLNLFQLETLATGTYQGTVSITPSGSSASVNIPVTLTVSPEPTVTISPSTVNLLYQNGGANNQGSLAVTLSTTGAVALPYQFGSASVTPNPAGCNWIVVNPTSGTIPANGAVSSAVSYSCPAGLPAGSYSGSFPVAVTGGAITPPVSTEPVNLLVSNSPLLYLPTQSVNFSYEIGTNMQATQTVTPQSTAVPTSATSGQMPLTASVTTASGGPWLAVTPTGSFTTGTPMSISINPAGLLPGVYLGTITVAPAANAVAGNGPQTILVSLLVADDPAIQASTSSQGLTFPYQIGMAVPAAQTVNLSSSTGAPLTYSVTSSQGTCAVNPLSLGGTTAGTTNGSFTVSLQNPSSYGAGQCGGTITVTATNPATGNAAIGSPLSIPFTLYVSNNPLLVVNPQSLTFTSAVGGGASTQAITVASTNPNSNIVYSVSETTTSGGSWLLVSSSGSTASGQNTVSVSVNPGLLSAGNYTGTVTITASGSGTANSPVTIPVTLQVNAGTLSLSNTSLGFTYVAGGSNPVAQTVQVTGTGGTLNFVAAANSGTPGANWLSVTPTSGTTPGTLSIGVNGANLSPGTYQGTVAVTAPNASGSPATIQVTLTVTAGTISASPSPAAGLTFTQPAGGVVPGAQFITVSSTPVAISFSASATTTSGGNWLSVSPTSGTTTGMVQVAVNAGSLAVGTYTGTVTIAANGAAGSPITYTVTLNVVTPITIIATPAALNFGAVLNATAPAAQTVQVSAQGPPGVGTLAVFPFTTTVKTASGGNWLSVTPTTGNDPGTISVSVSSAGLTAGNYTGTITIASGSQNGAAPATVTVNLTVTTAPTPVIAAVANAASGFIGGVSPGEEVAIYGSNFGPSTVVGATPTGGSYPTTLSNTQVLFDGTPAPVIAVTNGQVNVMVPYGVSGRAQTAVQISYLGVLSTAISYNVNATVPGIYTLNQTGSGQGAILNQDESANGPNNPAAKGTVVAVYMTGEGITTPPSTTGQLAVNLNKPVLPVTATVNGVTAQVQYAGSAPGLVYGVMQVNVQLPPNTPTGNQTIVITVGTTNTQTGVTVAVQ